MVRLSLEILDSTFLPQLTCTMLVGQKVNENIEFDNLCISAYLILVRRSVPPLAAVFKALTENAHNLWYKNPG